MRALVTGSGGSLGRALSARLEAEGWHVMRFDLTRWADGREDVTRPLRPASWYGDLDIVFHLAAAKHAPEGELDPWETARVNVLGTRNVLELGTRTILASTCKAADPETVYGATKLIAERMVLEAGGSVARFYNVRESSGNVFEAWANVPAGEPIPVTPCSRYFMPLDVAVQLLVELVDQPPGRYTRDPGPARWMVDVALEQNRPLRVIPARRGDRLIEPRIASSERITRLPGGLERIWSPHDPIHDSRFTNRESRIVKAEEAACG